MTLGAELGLKGVYKLAQYLPLTNGGIPASLSHCSHWTLTNPGTLLAKTLPPALCITLSAFSM